MEIPVWPPVEVREWPPGHVMTEQEFMEYSGGHSLEPSQSRIDPMSFDPTKLIADYNASAT